MFTYLEGDLKLGKSKNAQEIQENPTGDETWKHGPMYPLSGLMVDLNSETSRTIFKLYSVVGIYIYTYVPYDMGNVRFFGMLIYYIVMIIF